MDLLTRQQAEHLWFEADPLAQFDDLLEALGLYKDISTEYGLNQSVHHQWRFGDPHKKSGEPDRHDYEIKVVDGFEVVPGPTWHSLYRWIVSQAADFLAFQTVYLITDNRDLLAETVTSTAGLSHWPMVAAWWKERIRYVGPYGERTTVVFVPISADTGWTRCTPRGLAPTFWMRVFFSFQTSTLLSLTATVCLSHFSKFRSCGLSCVEHDPPKEECRQPEAIPSSPIAPAQKRARSVDTGQATQQQPGPPIKLPKSRSVENLVASAVRSPPPDHTGNFEDEVDFGGSEPSSPRPTEHEEEKSRNSSPTAQSCPGSTDKRATTETPKPVANKGVILVSEAFTEINAGLVIVLASGHRSPILESDLVDPERDPDELAAIASTAYLGHVESYLSTTQPPCDTETAVSSGLLGSPLLGTATRCTADWCHAWSLLGQWSGLVTFPVPATGQWPRHGHLRGILDGFQGRQPNFHKWARPAYEQGALPTLSLLPGEVVIKVLPGDKIYQAMEIEPGFMRPAILHGFGTRAKQRLPSRLEELAQFGWLPLAAALFGTAEWQPQWLHHNFLPVIGLRVHAKIPPSPLSYQQQVALLGLWETKTCNWDSVPGPCPGR